MNQKRIDELQQFKNNFNDNLETALEQYQKTKNNPQIEIRKKSMPIKLRKEIQIEPSLPWREHRRPGGYFNKIQLIEGIRDISPTEIARIPLIKRSYENPETFLNGKSFIYSSSYPKQNNLYSENNNLSSLTKSGQNLVSMFINENKRLEKIKIKCEGLRRSYEINHAMLPRVPNPIIKENYKISKGYFSVPEGDIFSGYKPKEISLDTLRPFRNKLTYDLFDKDIYAPYPTENNHLNINGTQNKMEDYA